MRLYFNRTAGRFHLFLEKINHWNCDFYQASRQRFYHLSGHWVERLIVVFAHPCRAPAHALGCLFAPARRLERSRSATPPPSRRRKPAADAVATASTTSKQYLPQIGVGTSARPGGPINFRRLRPQQPVVGLSMTRPSIGEHDLHLEGELEVSCRSKTILHVPISMTLSGSLSPAFVHLAQQQFEMVMDQLLVKPATVAFIAHLEDVKAARKTEAQKATQASASEFDKDVASTREILNRKA